jgi:hypothetical protein
MPPQTNSTLIQISNDGQSDDWDVVQSSGPTVWSGSAGAYVQEKVSTNFSQNEGSLVKSKDLQIVLDMPFAERINTGHILSFQWRGQTHSRRVMEYNGADFPGVPNYRRFHLHPEPIEIELEND